MKIEPDRPLPPPKDEISNLCSVQKLPVESMKRFLESEGTLADTDFDRRVISMIQTGAHEA